MIHSSFDAIAQFLHRKTEEAKSHTLDWIGPRLAPAVFYGFIAFIVGFSLFLVFVLTDTMFDLGYLEWTQSIASRPGQRP